jgi:radical SAM superfamily enzyme YgiQ (UPF0313 family)
MRKRILLVNPPIYDFSAYDFWLKPYGLLRVGGYLRNSVDLRLFDFLDRNHPFLDGKALRSDPFGRGKFLQREIEKPHVFSQIPRKFRRYGLPEQLFRDVLLTDGPFDAVLVQSNMTYWYPGITEVLRVVRENMPGAEIVIGGVYATLCPDHARTMGADLIVEGCRLEPLWDLLDLEPDETQPPFWEGYRTTPVGVLKLAEGCPFRCTYCSIPQTAPVYRPFAADFSWKCFQSLLQLGTNHLVFYDDALLFRSDEVLIPFLRRVTEHGFRGSFYTPNALNARFLRRDLAQTLVKSRFHLFYLGFESGSDSWQQNTGGKVSRTEFEEAVHSLLETGVEADRITAYVICGHPETEAQEIEHSMKMVHALGIRIMLSEYSPIPGTPDGEKCRHLLDLDEPLLHNKTAFVYSHLGREWVQNLKDLCVRLNSSL